MFESLANVVTRRGWIIVLGWLAFTITLWWVAPPWERVSRDDDVRFFPPGSLSVIGQSLLERGFPQDAASAQVVVIGERRGGPLTPADFDFLDRQLVPLLNQAREGEPVLGSSGSIPTARRSSVPGWSGRIAKGPGQGRRR